jgi:hypothetical protein
MLSSSGLTTAEVLEVFSEEVLVLGGRVTDSIDDGRRLFARSVLPGIEEVRRGDGVQGGVAVKALEGEVWLFPYVFRLVCRNGAIIAETVGSWSIAALHQQEPYAVLQSIREGVGICCGKEVFAENVRKMRTACEVQADFALTMLPMLSRLSGHGQREILAHIMNQFFREKDHSQFGLANAITAIARDTRDPELRWNLEEFGGAVAIGKAPNQPVINGGTAARVNEMAAVG